ncbi:unnamed protein product, partial [Mesorhabditis belari]|uniref:Uncharacterized protein n=1 Tax=Mesorhabditis belari TaxID=2138241 RepID=A0AAF3EH18_9BILA
MAQRELNQRNFVAEMMEIVVARPPNKPRTRRTSVPTPTQYARETNIVDAFPIWVEPSSIAKRTSSPEEDLAATLKFNISRTHRLRLISYCVDGKRSGPLLDERDEMKTQVLQHLATYDAMTKDSLSKMDNDLFDESDNENVESKTSTLNSNSSNEEDGNFGQKTRRKNSFQHMCSTIIFTILRVRNRRRPTHGRA